MAASLEMEHGAILGKDAWHMLHEAETFCRDTIRGGRPLIEDDRSAPAWPG